MKIFSSFSSKQTKTTSQPPLIPEETLDQEKTPTRPDDNEFEENLLIPLRTASEQSSLACVEEEINMKCLDCRYVAKTHFALKMHQLSEHNVRPLNLICLSTNYEMNFFFKLYVYFLGGEEEEEKANSATIKSLQ